MQCTSCNNIIISRRPNKTGLCFSCYQKDYSRKNKDRKRERAKQLRHEKLKKICTNCGISMSIFNRSGFCNKCYSVNFNNTHRKERTLKARQYANTITGKLRRRCRDRIRDAIRLFKIEQNIDSLFKPIGCTIFVLTQYLESKFEPGMTWDNYGKYGWHIDHKKPLSSFDLSDPEQLKEACNYKNLQPLWAKDNLKKGDRYE